LTQKLFNYPEVKSLSMILKILITRAFPSIKRLDEVPSYYTEQNQ